MNYTDEQQAAIDTRAERICVDAGAGSGKTRVLIDRIMFIVEQEEARLDEIVAITFTDRAAAEMKARLRKNFHQRAGNEREDMDRWRRLERQAENARISTIHTFCGALIRENGLHLGLDPEYTVLDEAQGELLRNSVIRDTLHGLLEANDAAAVELTTEYRVSRVEAMLRTMLRKRFLMERIATDLPLESPETMAQHWADTLLEVREQHVHDAAREQFVFATRNSLSTYEQYRIAPSDKFENYRRQAIAFLDLLLQGASADAVWEMASEIAAFEMRGGSGKVWGSKETIDTLKEELKALRDWVRAYFPKWEDDPDHNARAAVLTWSLFQVYGVLEARIREEKQRIGCVDFDDIILHALHALQQNEALRHRVAANIRFLLMDEFQDTDGIQLEIARLLCESPNGPALFLVGDAKQSIYYFRGAEVEVFSGQRDTANKTLPLSKNFRTQAGIIGFVNQFFSESGLLHEVEPEYRPMEAHRDGLGPDRIAILLAGGEDEEKPSSEQLRQQEAALLAAKIRELCDQHFEIEDAETDQRRPVGYGDFAILFRSMSHVQVYEDALRRAGIPYALVAGGGYYERQEVLDLLNLLKVVVDPLDEMALLGFLRSPMAAVTDNDLSIMALDGGIARHFNAAAFPDDLESLPAWQDAHDLVVELRVHQHEAIGAFMHRVLEATQYEAVVLTQYLALQKASNIRKLMALAEDFALSRTPSLRDFVRYLETVRSEAVREGEALLQPEDRGAVTIMTIHKSKGLEFPVVALPELSVKPNVSGKDDLALHRKLGAALRTVGEGGEVTFPAIGQVICKQVGREEHEERSRILYVALTRARDYLILSGNTSAVKNSYMCLFSDWLALEGKADGAILEGEGWRAALHRNLDMPATKSDKQNKKLPKWETTAAGLREALPLGLSRNISITRLLNGICAPDDEAEDEPVKSSAGTEPTGAAFGTGQIGMLRGALVHRLFEIWDGQSEPPVAELFIESATPLGLRRKLREALMTLAERAKALPLSAEIFGPGVQREAQFAVSLGEHVLRGIVDLVLADGSILDYKTGRFDEARHERYLWQLRIYAWAMAASRGVAPQRGHLLYVDEGRIESIDITQEVLRETEETLHVIVGKGIL